MKNTTVFSFLILIILTLPSCTFSKKSPEEMPNIDFPSDELNTDISLTAPQGWNDFKTDSRIDLDVKVISNNSIIFSPDCNIRAFMFEDGWTELKNQLTYAYTDDMVVSPGTDWMSGTTCSVLPNLRNPEKAAQLRIFVFGHVYENNIKTNDAVGAYIDVVLNP